MRQVVLDTETTGLEVNKGHRIVEIGCVELLERRPTGREFHYYVNPQRAMDEGATAVSGITDDFLVDKPLFADIAEEFLAFIDGAELIAHNASFDMGFLSAEFARLPQPVRVVERVSVLDTLLLAREKYPGQKNNLDALCKRLGVDNSHRDLHGALLDAQLLADVYLAMTAGQGDLGLGLQSEPTKARVRAAASSIVDAVIRVRRADVAELAAHAARLAAIQKVSKENCRWLRE
ncbi:DNA polymerase III subunit epsilon [Rudaea cellulosilytica]|uniref:DNA polymerase III subunit epsilon n=1 Tax=Rudaea cellulosilytica TaxID=540746 RepID=UPI0004773716|nr:DNA polymerase III subunit epsilon [Rudaea cellulosilytica]